MPRDGLDDRNLAFARAIAKTPASTVSGGRTVQRLVADQSRLPRASVAAVLEQLYGDGTRQLQVDLQTVAQMLRPSKGTRVKVESSMDSKQRTLIAALGLPSGPVPKPNGAQPQCRQKWCRITCLLKV